MRKPEFYVYLLLDPRKECEPFYVGKGRGLRYLNHLNSKQGRNKLKNGIINKIKKAGLPVGIFIAKKNISEYEAFILEKHLIKFFGRRDLKKGPLANLTNGGEGQHGVIYSKKRRKQMSQRMLGKNHPNFGKKLSRETCNKKIYGLEREN